MPIEPSFKPKNSYERELLRECSAIENIFKNSDPTDPRIDALRRRFGSVISIRLPGLALGQLQDIRSELEGSSETARHTLSETNCREANPSTGSG